MEEGFGHGEIEAGARGPCRWDQCKQTWLELRQGQGWRGEPACFPLRAPVSAWLSHDGSADEKLLPRCFVAGSSASNEV